MVIVKYLRQLLIMFGHTKYTHNLFKHDELPQEYRYLTENVPEIKKHLKTTFLLSLMQVEV